MAVAMASFTMNDTITKAVSSQMNFGQVMLVRGLFAILLVAAFAWHQGALRPLRTLMLKPVALRVFGEIGGTISFMAALAHLPLANTSAIFQALPLAITLGAAVIFGEPVGWRRWSAIVAGFIGVLIIVRPGIEGFNQFSLLAMVSVAFCALRDLATRQIPAQIPSLFITLLMTVTVTAAGAVIVFPLGGWIPPSTRALAAGAGRGPGADRLSLRDHVTAVRRHLRGGAVPLFRAAVGDAARLSRVRRQARCHDDDGRRDHRLVRPLRLLPRTHPRPPGGGDDVRYSAGWAVTAVETRMPAGITGNWRPEPIPS